MKTSLTISLTISIFGILSNPAMSMDYEFANNQINSLEGVINRNIESGFANNEKPLLKLSNFNTIDFSSKRNEGFSNASPSFENPIPFPTNNTGETIINRSTLISIVEF